ncbi:MAG: CRISPR-associated protein Cas4 [Spirochaetales bacterium]|nr:CRISPR-associated protein Cas4 [Spirochaetales bacterium]
METAGNRISITPSLVLEYLFCPRFIYFMEVLKIPQHEDKRFKVLKGRIVHKSKAAQNIEYKRKKLGVIDKKTEQELASLTYHIHGVVDEILFLNDHTAAPLDYKFARYKGKIFKTYKTQSILYGLLIKDNYNIDVRKGYIVYTRSDHHLEEIPFYEKDIKHTIGVINDILKIMELNYFPKSTGSKRRCIDCCYNTICVK